jgi:hypothetical protein
MVDVPDVAVSNAPYVALRNSNVPDVAPSSSNTDTSLTSEYLQWFLLRHGDMIPVVLCTEDVGNASFDCMQHSGRLMVVSPGADNVAESFERFL